jgi:hypothetical protein
MTFVCDFDGTLTVQSIGDIIDEKNIEWNDYARMKDEMVSFTPKKGIGILAEFNLKPLIITGRQESLRDVSELWLFNNKVPYTKLIMVPDGYYGGKFNFNKYVDFKVEEHLKVNPRFSIDDNKRIVTVLKQYDIPAFLVEDNFEETLILAINTIMETR